MTSITRPDYRLRLQNASEIRATGQRYIPATACVYPPAIDAADILLVDFDCHEVKHGALYLVEEVKAGKVQWKGCRRFDLLPSGVQIDVTGGGDWIYVDPRRENSGISGAFSDPRVFLVTPFDERLAVLVPINSMHCQVQQGEDSPTYLVIGPSVTDESLRRASERFGISIQDLMAFRATNEDVIRALEPKFTESEGGEL